MAGERDTWITGIGLISSLGEGSEIHWKRLLEGDAPVTDNRLFPGYVVHPLAKIDFDRQIPKKGDQRQMEPWQRIGTYAAGLALADAGIAGNAEILSRTDMIVAAGGGERDTKVDTAILTDLRRSNRPDALLNERLQSDLRPTLFLAQLSNLLAGNISIVHGVVGSSRTFMGEEGAGVSALRVASARIAAGQSEIALVGGAYNSERLDTLINHIFNDLLLKGEFAPVLAPNRPAGFTTASVGAFLVLEASGHARRRGAQPTARLAKVKAANFRRQPGAVEASLSSLLAETMGEVKAAEAAIMSMATGVEPATGEEGHVLAATGLPVRLLASRFGHGIEAAFPTGLAVAALAVKAGCLFAATPGVPIEEKTVSPLRQVIVTCVGHWRGEGIGLVEALH
jgi:3-oxoacyl-[acyl-carrier-protein] synthase II